MKAYDIDFAAELDKNPNASTQTLVGESNIDTILARKYQGKEFHYHCSIKISEEHFSQKAMKSDIKDDDNLESILADKKEAAQLNEYLRRLRNLVGDVDEETGGIDPSIVQKPELVLAF